MYQYILKKTLILIYYWKYCYISRDSENKILFLLKNIKNLDFKFSLYLKYSYKYYEDFFYYISKYINQIEKLKLEISNKNIGILEYLVSNKNIKKNLKT